MKLSSRPEGKNICGYLKKIFRFSTEGKSCFCKARIMGYKGG